MGAALSLRVKSGLQPSGFMFDLLRNPSEIHLLERVWMKIQTALSGPGQANVKRILFTWSGMIRLRDTAGRAAMFARNTLQSVMAQFCFFLPSKPGLVYI